MPAKRLPWAKVWPEMLEHEKFATMPDALMGVWLRTLLRASHQPKRWRFASVAHCAAVIGRPAKVVRQLVDARLLDETPDGVLVHDAEAWQDVYPSDYAPGLSENTPRRVRGRSANAPSIKEEDSANTPATLPEDSANAAGTHAREGRGEIEKGDSLPLTGESVASAPTRAPIPKPPPRKPLPKAVQVANSTLHITCDENERALIAKGVGDDEADLEKWTAVCLEWRARRHRPQVRGPLDWFKDGIPTGKPQRNGHATNGAYVAPATAKQPPPPALVMTPDEAARSDAARERVKAMLKTNGIGELKRATA